MDIKKIIRLDLTNVFQRFACLVRLWRIEPVKKGKMSDLIFLTGKPVNRKRAQPVKCQDYDSTYTVAIGR
jgi:hypothetical protein